MQRGRERNGNSSGAGDPFGSFGIFGSNRSIVSDFFCGRDPFDDPFFTHPFSSMFGSSMFSTGGPSHVIPIADAAKGPVIEELNSDDEGEEGEENKTAGDDKNAFGKHSGSTVEPSVEHPDDDAAERLGKNVNNGSDQNRVECTRPQAQTYSFHKVSYGGINGTYYTSSTSRRMGSDRVVLEEGRAADATTGQAEHRISRGIHDKGHSVTRKLNSDGKVDTTQILHNLNEDELAVFEETWNGNAGRHLPGFTDGFNFHGNAGAGSSGQTRQPDWGGWALPSIEPAGNAGRARPDYGAGTNSSGGEAKKVVRIPVE